jgi:hypothetical protein
MGNQSYFAQFTGHVEAKSPGDGRMDTVRCQQEPSRRRVAAGRREPPDPLGTLQLRQTPTLSQLDASGESYLD